MTDDPEDIDDIEDGPPPPTWIGAARYIPLGAMPAKLGGFVKTWTPRAIVAGLFGGYFAGMMFVGTLAHASKDMPNGESFYTPNRPVSVKFVDRFDRDILVRGAAEMRPAKLSRLPEYIPNAVIAVEDRRFYNHTGVDPIGLVRAVYKNQKAGRVVEGGSTLTQQLAKNVYLTPDRTYRRKFQEMMLAVWLEYNFTKTEILETYLSRVPFGANAWGIEAASENYFGKPASNMSLSEAAILAGLLKANTRYNPASNPGRAAKRAALVLSAMADQGHINRAAQYAALTAPVNIVPPVNTDSANYFVNWIWDDMIDIIGTPATDIIVRTTLDRDAQKVAAAAAKTHLDPSKNARQAAIVTLDGTGGVKVMVGGADYAESQFNRAVQALRQPGSAFKPFVYLAAFESGIRPWDIRRDEAIKIGDWEPRNFSEKFAGDISLESAFGRSINTVAVALAEEIGRERVIETAAKLGAGKFSPLRSMALGAQGMTPLGLTASYMPFANYGDAAPAYGIESISTSAGRELYRRPPTQRRKVIETEPLGHINRAFLHAVNTGTGKQAKIKGRDVAGKTGTTNDFRDAWFVGFVQGHVTGVWVGADDNTPMARVTGGSIPAKIWKDVMTPMVDGSDYYPLYVSKKPAATTLPPEVVQSKAFEMFLSNVEGGLRKDAATIGGSEGGK
ncbi:MAG: transglycosylase domain-containing protein [Maricaulaceae bacterium]